MKIVPSAVALDAEFGRSDGRAHHLRFKDFDPTKDVDEIKASLSKLTKLSIFDKNDIGLFDEVRHARVIEKREREIFDKMKEADEAPAAAPVMAESVQEEAKPEPTTQVQEPVNYIEYTEAIEDICVPEDLNITNEYPKPGWLIQTIELPANVHSWDLSKDYVVFLLNACLPARTTLEDIAADDQSVPAKLIVSATIIEEVSSKIEQVDAPNKESPPEKSKKKRKRLLERVRKRE